MNRSRYVVESRIDDDATLLFNTANGAFAQLGQRGLQVWRGQAEDASIERQLLDAGFFTELSPQEELARQQRVFDAQRTDTSELVLSLMPTYACNNRCPYCYEREEVNIKGKMDERLMDAIMTFVDKAYARDGFSKLSVQWYGGDPSLALDVVEKMTAHLLAWCDERQVEYDANMLSNGTALDEEKVALLKRCRISLVMLTIDGPEEIHNKRRVSLTASNAFESTMRAGRLLKEQGVPLLVNMNVDKVNGPYYEQTREMVLEELGVSLTMGKLNDYIHVFGEGTFCEPDFDLFTHDEFFQFKLATFEKQAHDVNEMRNMLRPVGRFCTGQMDNYFIIDCLGDVYNCDGWVGKRGHIRFNLFDDESTWKLHEVTFNATQDEKCKECEMLPLCLGSCIWERSCNGMPCFPLKSTIDGYLRVYRNCFDAAIDEQGVTLLAEPLTPQELGWEGTMRELPNYTERHNIAAKQREKIEGTVP